MMPGARDGVEVARKARERHPDIPILYMTGRPDMLRRVGPVGPHEAILLKPYGLSQVLSAVERLLGGVAPA